MIGNNFFVEIGIQDKEYHNIKFEGETNNWSKIVAVKFYWLKEGKKIYFQQFNGKPFVWLPRWEDIDKISELLKECAKSNYERGSSV